MVSHQANYTSVDVRRIDSLSLGSAHRKDAESFLLEKNKRRDAVPLYLPHPLIGCTNPKNTLPVDGETENLSKRLLPLREDRYKAKTIESKKPIHRANPKIAVRCLSQSLNSACRKSSI